MDEAVAVESNVEVNQEVNQEPEPKKESKPIVRICSHIKGDGIRCGTPALNGRQFCYFHQRAHHPGARIATRRYRAPLPDSAASLQIAMAHAMQALMSGDLTPKQANSIMYGINLSTNLLRLSKPLSESEKQQVVTDIPEAMEEVLVAPETGSEEADPKEPEQMPAHLTRAAQVVYREIERLRCKVLEPLQLREFEQHVRTLKGTSDPRYYIACTRISHHDEAVQKLHEMGIV